jgi:hypothetical protein
MATNATVVLDSGVFLNGLTKSGPWDVGYFESVKSIPNIRIYADGKAVDISSRLSVPVDKSTLEVQHLDANGKLKESVEVDGDLSANRLTFDRLYGQDKEIDETKFDCTIRFHSGYFRPSMIKARRFKSDQVTPGADPPKWIDSIAHNIVVHYTIEGREELRLVKGNQTIWSSKGHADSAKLLEIEFIADHATAEQFYRDCLKNHTGPHWLPNQGDPPPAWPTNK